MTKSNLAELVELGSPMEKVAKLHQEDPGAWLKATIPALKGPHAGRPWIKHVLKKIASVQGVA